MPTEEKLPRQHVTHFGKGISFNVQVFLIPDGNQVVAYCPALELSTYGESAADATTAFGEALELFVADTQAKGTLEQVLLDLGWKLQRVPTVNYEPPSPTIEFLNSIGTGPGSFTTVSQPMRLAYA